MLSRHGFKAFFVNRKAGFVAARATFSNIQSGKDLRPDFHKRVEVCNELRKAGIYDVNFFEPLLEEIIKDPKKTIKLTTDRSFKEIVSIIDFAQEVNYVINQKAYPILSIKGKNALSTQMGHLLSFPACSFQHIMEEFNYKFSSRIFQQNACQNFYRKILNDFAYRGTMRSPKNLQEGVKLLAKIPASDNDLELIQEATSTLAIMWNKERNMANIPLSNLENYKDMMCNILKILRKHGKTDPEVKELLIDCLELLIVTKEADIALQKYQENTSKEEIYVTKARFCLEAYEIMKLINPKEGPDKRLTDRHKKTLRKWANNSIVNYYCQEFAKKFTSLRQCNLVGPFDYGNFKNTRTALESFLILYTFSPEYKEASLSKVPILLTDTFKSLTTEEDIHLLSLMLRSSNNTLELSRKAAKLLPQNSILSAAISKSNN